MSSTQLHCSNVLGLSKMMLQENARLGVWICTMHFYISKTSLCFQGMWRTAPTAKRKRRVYTPAKGSRDATINSQGQVYSVRAPIISFQYPALTCTPCMWACTCGLFCNPLSQAHIVWQVRKLADRWRHRPIHYSSAVTQRFTLHTYIYIIVNCRGWHWFFHVRQEMMSKHARSFLHYYATHTTYWVSRWVYMHLFYWYNSPVPVGSVVGEPPLVEAALGEGLLLVQDKLLQTHLHLCAGYGTWCRKVRRRLLYWECAGKKKIIIFS